MEKNQLILSVKDLNIKVNLRGKVLHAIRGISLDLYKGESLAIVGESGSGKSTLRKAISARLTPQQGEVLYQQRSLYAMSEAERRRLLRTEWGVVHQHPMDGLRCQVSAGGNIGERLMATGARHYGNIRATAEKWLQEVEIPPSRIDDLPTTFSGGMQQRLQLGAAVVHDPDVIVLDEPTVGIDPVLRELFWAEFRRLKQLGRAMIVTTHVMDEAEKCDRLILLRDGKIIQDGTPNELKAITTRGTLEAAFIESAKHSETKGGAA